MVDVRSAYSKDFDGNFLWAPLRSERFCSRLEARDLQLLTGVRRHLLDHGEDQLAVAVIEVGGVAADLAEETDFVVGELRQSLRAGAGAGFGEEWRERDLHGPGNFRKRVERRDGVAVFYARQVAAQQTGALLNVSLGHAFLQPVVSDGLADVNGRKHFRMIHSNEM